MQIEMTANVLGATRYEVDGNRGGTLWVANRPESPSADLAGLEVSKMACPYEIIEQLKKESFPCTLSLLCEVRKGPNLTTKLTVSSFKPSTAKPRSS